MSTDPNRPFHKGTLPLSVALIPASLFTILAYLSDAVWPGLERSGSGYLLLGLAVSLPMLVLCVRTRGIGAKIISVALASLGSLGLTLHAGLANRLALDLDTHPWPSSSTLDAGAGVLLTVLAIPLGMIIADRISSRRITTWSLIPAIAGASGQLIWFGLTRIMSGPGGIELWMWSRVAILLGAGALAGLLLGSVRLFGAARGMEGGRGPTEVIVRRLPSSLPMALLLLMAISFAGTARVISSTHDRDRFVRDRIDEYYLALSNIRMARGAGMEYPQLGVDLENARRALLGAADFDPTLPSLLKEMMRAMENGDPGPDASQNFRKRVLAVDRHMFEARIPYFLEPHEMVEEGARVRFVMRYAVSSKKTAYPPGAPPLPLLRLRRLDKIMVDTPYTGLSYPGMGTIMMDHIDDSALRVHGRVLSSTAHLPVENDGKFAAARAAMRADKRSALRDALARRGHADPAVLEGLATMGSNWAHRIDTSEARRYMNSESLAAYDALTDLLAAQTEVHETRHALDGDLDARVEALELLHPGPLSGSAAAEIRAHLTEIVEGPLGPRFGVATVFEMLAGENARANAYFFASIVILEGIWGDVVRKPDVLTVDGESGPEERTLPIGPGSPGWLSYSRIGTCYGALRSLPPEELRKRAKRLFEDLFSESYRPVVGQV